MKHPLRTALALFLCSLAAVLMLTSCSPRRPQASAVDVNGQRLELDLVPGPYFRHSGRFLIFSITTSPQIACWIEAPDGKYLGTIYVTAKVVTRKWFGAPSSGRPEALPVWSHARAQASLSADAVTGATPAGTLRVQSPLGAGLQAGAYVVKLEVNNSFDYNERYTRANSGVNGQPSVVYAGPIDIGTGESAADLAPIGTGSVDGRDGNITPGLEGITTAREILASVRVLYHDR